MGTVCPTGISEEVIRCLFYKIYTVAVVVSVLGASYHFSQKEWSNRNQYLQRNQSSVVSVCCIDDPINRGFIFI